MTDIHVHGRVHVLLAGDDGREEGAGVGLVGRVDHLGGERGKKTHYFVFKIRSKVQYTAKSF